jgi:hypothetical protein
MAGDIFAFAQDIFSVALFENGVAFFAALFLFFGALSLGLLVVPEKFGRPAVRALAGFPLLFIFGGTIDIVLYALGVNIFYAGIFIVLLSVVFFGMAIYLKKFQAMFDWKEIGILIGLLLVGYLLMYFGWGETRDGTIRAISGSWADGVLHTLNAEAFKLRGASDFSMPAYSGENFHEPFGYDFVAGVLLSLGFTIGSAFTLPAAGLLASLLALSGNLTAILIKTRKSVGDKMVITAAVITTGVFTIFASGLQWIVMPQIHGLWSLKGFFGIHYPVWDKQEQLGLIWANHINTFASQKHLLLAECFLMLLASALVYMLTVEESNGKSRKIFTGVLALATGFLPIFHAHAFIAAALLWFVFWAIRPTKKIFFLGLLIILVAAPIFVFLGGAVSRTGFTQIAIGYLSKPSLFYWVFFWLVNLGAILPITIIAMFGKKHGIARWALGIPALVLFILGNIVQFQPYLWDNYKIFVFAWFLVMPLAVSEMFSWTEGRKNKINIVVFSILIAVIFLSEILTTVSETATYFNFRYNFPLFSSEERVLAKEMEKDLPPNAVVLAATNIVHKDPVILTGRNLFLGYGGWIWTRGLLLSDKETKIDAILNSDSNAELCKNLQRAGVTHVVVNYNSARSWLSKSSDFVAESLGLNSIGMQTKIIGAADICVEQ